jgi:adenine phosphoribosyltransferase
MNLLEHTRTVADFPSPGILFRDISPILAQPQVLDEALEQMTKNIKMDQFELIVGIESRGFILGSAMAVKFKKGFVPCRKAGKLPPPVKSFSYKLEYGEATLEMNPGKGRVLVVDDVLATGGTLDAAIFLCEASGYEVHDVAVLINLEKLNQFSFKGNPVKAAIKI